ncbi:MAG: hypothetical protein QF926_13190 [Alphaproteobacteria bacterium]|nr:hypothetical protein [Alphaproteobacteria bacterium]
MLPPRLRWIACLGVALSLGGCAGDRALIADSVTTALDIRGDGRDSYGVIANLIAHQGKDRPLGINPVVSAILNDPLAVLDDIEVRAAITGIEAIDEEAAAWRPAAGLPDSVADLIVELVARMVAADRLLRDAWPPDCCDGAAALAEITGPPRRTKALETMIAAIDRPALDQAVAAFVGFGDFVIAALAEIDRETWGEIGWLRFDSPIGPVRIGSALADRHLDEAVLIIDPGGDDRYERGAATMGAVRVVIDLDGNDRYGGEDPAVLGLTGLFDRTGADRYHSPGAGLGAALGGVAILYDGGGDDRYRASVFGQAAAVAGYAILIDATGNDIYEIGARGQGFAGPLGAAILRDRAGDDRYRAEHGLADPFGRGGGSLSYAQGVGFGFRGARAGGTGVLRDDAGDDRYRADKFAQGQGYYYGLGILADGAGADSYEAIRYAQGQGAHAGVGLLDDQDGDDRYQLEVGVGQGMGLDLGVGILRDSAGRDRYSAPSLGQGSTTGNGFGLLADRDGDDVYSLGAPGLGWGRGRGSRGLPGLALLIDEVGTDGFLLGGELLIDHAPRSWGGPMAGAAADLPPANRFACPDPGPDTAAPESRAAIDLLGISAPLFGTGADALAAYQGLQRDLIEAMPDLLAALPPGDVALGSNLRNQVRCFLERAEADRRQQLREVLIAALAGETPHAALLVAMLRQVPPAPRIAERLVAHPECPVRAGAVMVAGDAAVAADEGGEPAKSQALAALDDPCWQVKAAALSVLNRLQVQESGFGDEAGAGAEPVVIPRAAHDALPSMLKGRATPARQGWFFDW